MSWACRLTKTKEMTMSSNRTKGVKICIKADEQAPRINYIVINGSAHQIGFASPTIGQEKAVNAYIHGRVSEMVIEVCDIEAVAKKDTEILTKLISYFPGTDMEAGWASVRTTDLAA